MGSGAWPRRNQDRLAVALLSRIQNRDRIRQPIANRVQPIRGCDSFSERGEVMARHVSPVVGHQSRDTERVRRIVAGGARLGGRQRRGVFGRQIAACVVDVRGRPTLDSLAEAVVDVCGHGAGGDGNGRLPALGVVSCLERACCPGRPHLRLVSGLIIPLYLGVLLPVRGRRGGETIGLTFDPSKIAQPGLHILRATLQDGRAAKIFEYYRSFFIVTDLSKRTEGVTKTLELFPNQSSEAALAARQILETVTLANRTYYGLQACAQRVWDRPNRWTLMPH